MNFILPKLYALVLTAAVTLLLSLLNVPLPPLTMISGTIFILLAAYSFKILDDRLRTQGYELKSLAEISTQLYEQQVERVQQLGTLNKVLALLTETLSPDNVLDTVISSASAVSEATAIAVYLLQNDNQPVLVRSAGLSDEFSANPVKPLLTVSTYEIGDDPKVVVENVGRDARTHDLRSTMQREGKGAWVELPLRVMGRALGLMIVYFDQPQSFSDEQIELMRTFANQAAQAIQNADLYAGTYKALEKRVEQLSALAAIGRELTATMNLQTIADLMLKYTMEATGATTGAIVLLNEKRDGLELAAHHGYPSGAFSSLETLAQGITGQVIQTGKAVNCDDVRRSDAYIPLTTATHSQLSVPIVRRGDTLGAITLESEESGIFTEEACNFVEQLANQVVIAVDNARLFQRATEARDRMQAILDTMAEAIVLIDRWGNIALANPRVGLINLDSRQLIGQNIIDLLDREDSNLSECMGFASDQEARNLIKLLRTPGYPVEPGLLSYSLQKGNKMVYVHRQIIQVRDEDGDIVGMLLVFYNETEQHELEQARENFSRMIVHDLRSPLTAVTSSVMLLTEIIPPESEFGTVVEKTANASQRAIRKLLNRVDSLLDISRMQSGHMALEVEPVALEKLVDNVCAELGPLANDLGVSLIPRFADKRLLNIDPDKIERVLLNLVDNALKFSPRDSEIVIQARSYANGDMVRVDVVDRGPGVPEIYRKSIFDSFVQIKEQRRTRRGSGLGLTFCKLAIEAHGGRIWIEENPNGGSIFSFTVRPFETPNSTLDEPNQMSFRDGLV
jgi:K+-sensing histidine kinase KdpD